VDAAHERLVALEQERGRRQAAAELLERQNQFLGDVSHELRTPVTIARGHLEALRTLPEHAVAIDELGRIERIIERLLVLARAEQPAAPREALDAEAFLEDRFVRWSDSILRSWQLDELAHGTLVADGDALAAALDALLENAVKHTREVDTIRLRSRAIGGTLAIEVTDGGDGIPAEALDRIFERFGRADSARNRELGGAGLGLAIVDAVARAHGGSCSVRSSPAGSTFTLRLSAFTLAGD
jgi:signal transduction histidine kinase